MYAQWTLFIENTKNTKTTKLLDRPSQASGNVSKLMQRVHPFNFSLITVKYESERD